MQTPLFVRRLTADERAAVEAGLRSARGLTVRRCHSLLSSAAGQPTTAMARPLRCNDQTVRNAIHDVHARGRAALASKSSRPHTTQATFDAAGLARLRALLHQSPRVFGKETRVWPLDLVAEVSFAQGLTCRRVSDDTSRAAIAQLGVRWKRAKPWLTSPEPAYCRTTTAATA
jgi:hypothetical protein